MSICVYVYAILCCRMPLLFNKASGNETHGNQGRETKAAVTMHCGYIPEDMLSIFRMSLPSKKTMKVHGVYIPDAISSILRMSLLIQNGSESELCVYSGCHFVYVADVTFA